MTVCRRGEGGPFELPGQEPGVGHVGQRVPLLVRAGEDEGLTPLAAERPIHGQGHAHVHSVAPGVADHRVRAMHRPAEATLGRGLKENVFLGVVEVEPRQSGIILAERGFGVGLAVGFEGSEIVLGAGDQRGVPEWLARQGLEQVAGHATVDAHVFRLGGLAQPGAEEDVRRLDVGQGGFEGLRILQVGGHRGDARHLLGLAGQARYLPAFGDQVRGEVDARDARAADNQGGFAVVVHGCLKFLFCSSESTLDPCPAGPNFQGLGTAAKSSCLVSRTPSNPSRVSAAAALR